MTAIAFLATDACDSAKPVATPTSLTQALDQLRAAGLTRANVERAFGARLAAGDANDAFAFYTAEGIAIGGVKVSLDWREPVAGGGATAGPLLNVRIGDGCPPRGDIERHYGPLEPTGVPRGRSPDETFSFSRDEPWGRLSFGFAERAPDCLALVTFAATR